MRVLNVVAWIAASAGVVTGIVGLLIAVEHNPQGALINQDTGAVDFRYGLSLFFSWFVIGSIITGIASSVVWWAIILAGRIFRE
jgi:hypothetical protein